MTCDECRLLKKELPGFDRDCDSCPMNINMELSADASRILFLFQILRSQIRVAGISGYPLGPDVSAILSVLDLYNIQGWDRMYYFEWLFRLIAEIEIGPLRKQLERENG